MTGQGPSWRRYLRFWGPNVKEDVDDELRFHVDARIAEFVRAGLSTEDARRKALEKFGDIEQVAHALRDHDTRRLREQRRAEYMDELLQDVRYGLRKLRKAPGFTAAVLAVLALGIGANAAMYSAVDAAFFRPLPFAEPERLVRVYGVDVPVDFRIDGQPLPKRNVQVPDLYAMRDVFSHTAVYATGGLNLTGGREPLRVDGTFVTTEFFETLGPRALLGRTFTPEETNPGGPNVVVISHRLWRTHFGADSALVGRRVLLNDAQYEVVGVMPEDFRFPSAAQLWVPLPIPAPTTIFTAFRNFLPSVVIARMAPGVTPELAAQRLDAARMPYLQADPRAMENARPAAELTVPLRQSLLGDRKVALTFLMASAGLVLLIACANVANLLLSRASGRRREIAMRAVLGASRGRIVRQLAIETGLLALFGALLGLLVAKVSLSALTTLMPPAIAGVAPAQIDARILAFTLVVAFAAALVAGLWPALGSSRADLGAAIKTAGGGSATRAQGRLRSTLVVSEVALACMLVVGAGLMLSSLRAILSTDVGMRLEQVATARLTLVSNKYRQQAERRAFIEAVVKRLREAPGVSEAAVINTLPLALEQGISLRIRPDVGGDDRPSVMAPYLKVSPGYFSTMGLALLRGRDLTWTDGAAGLYAPAGAGPRVAVINQAMADVLWPGEDALGKRFEMLPEAVTVVGIVANARIQTLGAEPGPQMYLPMMEGPESYLSIVARGPGDAHSLVAQIHHAVRAVDPNLPVYAAQPMESVVAGTVAPQRTNTMLITTFGALAVCLAGVGVYGVLAYAVAQRTREIGVRMALGARAPDVVRMVLRQGALLTALGIAIGLAAAFVLARYVESILFGVTARDPLVFAAAPVVLVAITLLATWLPARRAARVDPMIALRAE